MAITTNWTEQSVGHFAYKIAADFVAQLEKKLEEGPLTQKEFASKLGVSVGRVSQIMNMNNPSNFTLKRIVKYARALGMKVTVVAYDDDDPENQNGPINSEIFQVCWENAGRPSDFFGLATHIESLNVGVIEARKQADDNKFVVCHALGFAENATAENATMQS